MDDRCFQVTNGFSLSLMTCENMQGRLSSLKFCSMPKVFSEFFPRCKGSIQPWHSWRSFIPSITMSRGGNIVLTIFAVNVYHTWNSSKGPGFVLDPGRALKRCGRQNFMVTQILADDCSVFSLGLIELMIIINVDWCLGFCDLITARDLPDKRETSRLWLKKTLSLFIPRSWTCLSRKNQ